jgi:acetyl esterase/lipase
LQTTKDITDKIATLPPPRNNENDEGQEAKDDDDGFRKLRETWPLWLQHGLRDSGALRTIIDFLTKVSAAPAFFQENPQCFWELLRISACPAWITNAMHAANLVDSTTHVDFSIESYGPHRSQYAEVMVNTENKQQKELPLLIFVHGGAWGSGFPAMYRLVAAPFLERNFRVAILGYRTYPDATVKGQTDDIVRAVEHFASSSTTGPTVILAHSSGAHVSLLAALQGRLSSSMQGFIGMSGVYDIERHYEFECLRGVDQISPLSPACGGTVDQWRLTSPTLLVPTTDDSIITSLPPILFLHGDNDTTVPAQSSQQIHEALVVRNHQSQLQILSNVGHSDALLETLLGGKTQDAVFSWLESELGI